MIMRKSCVLLGYLTDRNIHKANSKIFQLNFCKLSLHCCNRFCNRCNFIVTVTSLHCNRFCASTLHARWPILRLKGLFSSLSFRRYHVFYLYIYMVFTSEKSNPRHYVEALINLHLSVAIIMLLS